jgi:hypothetical protein
MVMSWCGDISAPGSQYSRVDKNEVPHGRCGLNGARPIQKAKCQKSRQSSAMPTWLVCADVQAYRDQSQVCITEAIFW